MSGSRAANRFRPALECFEDRTTPSVVTAAAGANAYEGGGAGTVVLSRTDTTTGQSVNFSFGGTASSTDYAQPFMAYFDVGESSITITLYASDDSESEATETITFNLGSGSGYTVGTPASATINIFDNDAQVVSVAKIADAAEGGANGTLQFTRTGDLSSSLTANFTVGGTATSGTDYTSLGTTVTFAANSAIANVTVAVTPDAIYDPDETVTATVTSGTGYSVGGTSSATVNITDDISTVQTLIHQETFQLTGSSGNVNVTLSVTLNASGAAGLYTWSYTVSNPSSNTSSLTTFKIPVGGMGNDVANLTSSIGWTGTVGTDSVSWAAGTGLTPGSSATFAFTTDPREIGGAGVEAGGGGGFFADLPTAPAPKPVSPIPEVTVSFRPGTNNYTLRLSLTPADGSTGLASGDIAVFASGVGGGTTARDYVYGFLKRNGWAVEVAGDTGLRILGKVGAGGIILAPTSLNWTQTGATDAPVIQGQGQVTVTNNG